MILNLQQLTLFHEDFGSQTPSVSEPTETNREDHAPPVALRRRLVTN
jgi:hypothetical protein